MAKNTGLAETLFEIASEYQGKDKQSLKKHFARQLKKLGITKDYWEDGISPIPALVDDIVDILTKFSSKGPVEIEDELNGLDPAALAEVGRQAFRVSFGFTK